MIETATVMETLRQAVELFEQIEEREYDFLKLLQSGSLYLVHDYETQGDRPIGVYDCGSVKLDDTPAALYRTLFLFKPERVSFKDMYKSSFLALVSPDYSLLASVEFFKYEIGVYFGCAKEYLKGRSSGVISGMPGAYNGVTYQGEFPEAWFGLLTKLLNRKWMVYGGNNFEV